MAAPLLTDELWDFIRPFLPAPKARRFRYPGRKPVPDRQCLTGILFVLRTGIPWEYLPQEMGCGCGMTCWNRLSAWQRAGVWKNIHRALLDRLNGADRIDWNRAAIDSASLRAVGAGGKNRAQPHGPKEIRLQAPPRGRGQRGSLGGQAHRRQPARRHASLAAGR